MFAENRGTPFMAGHTTPPLVLRETFHWDGRNAVSQDWEPPTDEALALPDLPLAGPGTRGTAPVTVRMMSRIPSAQLRAIDWDRVVTLFTFALARSLLLAPGGDENAGVSGELVWVPRDGWATTRTLAIHPILLVQTASTSHSGERVVLVPHLPAGDPLHCHMTLVLQAVSTADSRAEHLYTEVLTHALAVHFLRRYAASKPLEHKGSGGLAPYKLGRTIAYIQAHLEEELPLVTLATVAQTSPAHFARLFKQATGQTPHQYVVMCRIARAKQLLTETRLPLSAVGLQVGCADQSYFTALFRKHVAMTPKAYRNATIRV